MGFPNGISPVVFRLKMVSTALAQEQIWFDKYRTEDAETAYYERKSGCCVGGQAAPEVRKILDIKPGHLM